MRAPSAVIVTGGTGALGRAVVLHLLSLGTRVAVAFRHAERWRALREAAGAGDALVGIEAELGDAPGTQGFVDSATLALGSLDGVALIAGGFRGGTRFEQAPDDELPLMLEQNLHTAARVCHAAIPRLLPAGGCIVAVGSFAALDGGAGAAAYSVSKAALHALVRVLALENEARGVRVNAVLPGTIDTPANRRAMPQADHSSWTPPEAIARTIAFLLSPDSALTTGALVPASGPA